jgi:transcriptional regulator with XRE-family HTH domain
MPHKILVQFGNKIREERHKQHLSQEQLAEKAGLHRTYIGMIERAEKNITLENIYRICKALGLNLSELFRGFND